ncbi:MAG: hypothetical protein GX895_08870 [Clostridiales bacterium]|uniref:Phage shock protein n=1 Tax=Thermoanaerobacterium thermosaccharolyticum TaxID=1517 RepID=A0A223I081_THETR|nr:hypothetical protein [Thermoanaerobacterium thermosaccharolyticum]AST58047.1 phage shock protein [Thermoanaerobacterium thermosaccharolyticum]NLZ48880.1 hypothetical protein [Clostridiales bacterium]
MLVWLSENITWIKDIFWVVFTSIATIVSIKTYIRAKSTILQPLRTEVIKRQTDLLVELLSFLLDRQKDFYFKIDYFGLVNTNVFLTMRDYGYLLNENKIYDEIDKNVVGFIILKNEGQLDNVELPQSINIEREKEDNLNKEQQEKGKKKLLLAREGKVDLERLYLTNQYNETIQKIQEFQCNPFMPSLIQSELSKLLNEISYNLTVILPPEIEKFIIQLSKTQCSPNAPVKVDPIAVYNYFQRKSIHHKDTIQNIIKIIREYLMVDKKWK